MTARPLILADGETIGALDTVDAVTIPAGRLAPGMVLLDDLGLPAAVVDHRSRRTNNAGIVRYLLEDLDRGGWTETPFLITTNLTVAASSAA